MVVGDMFKRKKKSSWILKSNRNVFEESLFPSDFDMKLKPSTSCSFALSKHLWSFYRSECTEISKQFWLLAFLFSVVSTLLSFVKTFERAHAENVKQMELEKKRAQAEAEKEKAKLGAHKKGESPKPGVPDRWLTVSHLDSMHFTNSLPLKHLRPVAESFVALLQLVWQGKQLQERGDWHFIIIINMTAAQSLKICLCWH